MPAEYVRVKNSESAARLWALEPKVRRLAETDPAFESEFSGDPLQAIRARFGDAAMPNEGEFVRQKSDGVKELVFPKTNAVWMVAPPLEISEAGELSDELLEFAGGDGNAVGPTKNNFNVGQG